MAEQEPAATRSVRTRLTGRGVVVLLLGVLASAAGAGLAYPSLLGTGAAFLVLVVASVVTVRVPVALAVRRRRVPRQVARLTDCTGELVVTNRSERRSVQVAAVDHVGGAPVTVNPVTLAPGASSATRSGIPTGWRGDVVLGPLVLRRRGLLGLATSSEPHGERTTVTVVPRVLEVRGPRGGNRRSLVGAEERIERGGTDLVGLREYVPGDDLRRLHWASSARSGTLVVREDADPAEPHLTVLVDDRASSYVADDLEEVMDVAVSLVVGSAAGGTPVRLTTWSGALVHDLVPAAHGLGVRQEDVAVLLRDTAALGTTSSEAARPVADHRGVDVLAVVSGRAAAVEQLVGLATATGRGTVLVVDPAPEQLLGVQGDVTVLRGARAEDLCRAWTMVVAA